MCKKGSGFPPQHHTPPHIPTPALHTYTHTEKKNKLKENLAIIHLFPIFRQKESYHVHFAFPKSLSSFAIILKQILFSFFFFEIDAHCVAEAGLELMILLLPVMSYIIGNSASTSP
jgi:hypothetical protein